MVLLDQSRLNRILKRMAYQVIEKSGGRNIDIIGLNERGFAVAEVIKSHITSNSALDAYQTQLYVDDTHGSKNTKKENDVLIITDDVIYSGRTMFKALQNLPELYKYSDVYVAAVIDRGHRKLPVEASILGFAVPTKVNEHVDFQLKDKKPYQVLLTKNNTSND